MALTALTQVTKSGIVTSINFVHNHLQVTGVGTFDGAVSIGGTLTYEDVTNIDSVGIVTARAGIIDSTLTAGRITYAGTNGRLTDAANFLYDGSELKVGTGITISSTVGVVTATSFVGSGTNLTALNATNLGSGTVPTARLGSGTANNTTFLRGDQSWQTVSGTTINNNADNRIITGSGTANTLEGEATLTYDGSVLNVDNDARFHTTAGGDFLFDKSDNALLIGDNTSLKFGAGTDFRLSSDGTADGGALLATGEFRIASSGSSKSINIMKGTSAYLGRFITDGAVELYHNGSKKLATNSGGIEVQDRVYVTGAEGAEAKVILQADEGDDNADTWKVEADTSGALNISNYASGSYEKNIECNGNGNVELYYDAVKKCETTSLGVKVTGDVQMGGTAGVRFHHTGTTSIFETQTAADSLLFKTTPSGGSTTERLRIASDGKIGIGINAPVAPLHIYAAANDNLLFGGNINASDGGAIRSMNSDASAWKAFELLSAEMRIGGTNSIRFSTSGTGGSTERLRITNDEKFGFGLSSPQTTIHVSQVDAGFWLGNPLGDGYSSGQVPTLKMYSDCSEKNAFIDVIWGGDNNFDRNITFGGSYLALHSPGSSNGAETVRITGGNLKLPDSSKIELGGAQTGSGDMQLYHDGTNNYIKWSQGQLRITGAYYALRNLADNEYMMYAQQDGPVQLYYNGVQKFETTSTGVKVTGNLEGQTGSATATHTLPVTISSWGWRFYNASTGSPYGLEIKYSGVTKDNSVSEFLNCLDTSAVRFKVTSDGDVWNHDNSYSGSDITLKENIVDASPKLEDLKKIKVRNFNWRAEHFPERSSRKMLGFIAQEVETVFPSLIKEYNITGDNDTPVMKKAIKQAWAPILVKALQEAVARIEVLETEVAALKST